MVLDAVSNFVRGRVSAPVATSDTTVSVEDASIFPDPATDGEYNVVIWDANNFPRPDQDSDVEIVRVTARDAGAGELTVVRGQETTSDVAHPEGSAVHLPPTAKMFSDIENTFADFWDSGTQTLTADVDNGSVSTDKLHNVSTGNELVDACQNAENGDWIKLASDEYVVDDWLDLNAVSNVTVEGEGKQASLITVADGADVGGFRVDNGSENIRITGVGFNGNPENQDSSVKRLHGVIVGDADTVKIDDCFFTRTHPYHEHDSGGSGISVRTEARRVWIENNRIDDIGDRGIQVAGQYVTVRGNKLTDGYDRHISLDVIEPDEQRRAANWALVEGNECSRQDEGTSIGMMGNNKDDSAADSYLRYISVVNNVLEGGRQGVMAIDMDADSGNGATNILVANNNIYDADEADNNGIFLAGAGMIPSTVTGNIIRDKLGDGIQVQLDGCTVGSNTIIDCRDDGIKIRGKSIASANYVEGNDNGIVADSGGSGTKIVANIVTANDSVGIISDAGSAQIEQNRISDNGEQGILVENRFSNKVTANWSEENNEANGGFPEIEVRGSRALVGMNFIRPTGPESIKEGADADENMYVGNFDRNNRSSSQAWDLSGGNSRAVGNWPNPDGFGHVVTTPDGSSEFEIRVDNDGNLEAVVR